MPRPEPSPAGAEHEPSARVGSSGPQVVPRPAGWQPGAAPPWSGLGPAARTGLDLARVRRKVQSGHPVVGHPAEDDGLPGRSAAVLVALFDEDGEAHVVLTRRAATLRSHRHQVSFPGGRLDQGERLEQTALREAEEEVGLDPAAVELLGRLPPFEAFAGLSTITPFVGALTGRPDLRPNPAEVERAFTVPLAELVAPGCHWEERWPLPDGALYPVHFFDLPLDLVWGATAKILFSFLSQLFEPDHR